MATDDSDLKMLQTTDARVWAANFIRHYESDPEQYITEELMVTWFANAIMVGHDLASRAAEAKGIRETLATLAPHLPPGMLT